MFDILAWACSQAWLGGIPAGPAVTMEEAQAAAVRQVRAVRQAQEANPLNNAGLIVENCRWTPAIDPNAHGSRVVAATPTHKTRMARLIARRKEMAR